MEFKISKEINGSRLVSFVLYEFSNFQGFDWESLSSQTMEPPYIPTVSSATDLTNFDQFDEPEDDFMAADNAEESGWDKEF